MSPPEPIRVIGYGFDKFNQVVKLFIGGHCFIGVCFRPLSIVLFVEDVFSCVILPKSFL